MNTIKKRIVVLGGSFNPPTLAHKSLLLQAVRHTGAELGLFVPSSDAYVRRKMAKLKSDNAVYSEAMRVQMLEAFCKGCRRLVTDPVELGDDGRGHTYDTLMKIQSKYPRHEIMFIIGSDKLTVLPKWKNAYKLFSQFGFIVMTRPPADEGYVREQLQRGPLLSKYEDKFIVLEADSFAEDASSSKARGLISREDWHGLEKLCGSMAMDIIRSEKGR